MTKKEIITWSVSFVLSIIGMSIFNIVLLMHTKNQSNSIENNCLKIEKAEDYVHGVLMIKADSLCLACMRTNCKGE